MLGYSRPGGTPTAPKTWWWCDDRRTKKKRRNSKANADVSRCLPGSRRNTPTQGNNIRHINDTALPAHLSPKDLVLPLFSGSRKQNPAGTSPLSLQGGDFRPTRGGEGHKEMRHGRGRERLMHGLSPALIRGEFPRGRLWPPRLMLGQTQRSGHEVMGAHLAASQTPHLWGKDQRGR